MKIFFIKFCFGSGFNRLALQTLISPTCTLFSYVLILPCLTVLFFASVVSADECSEFMKSLAFSDAADVVVERGIDSASEINQFTPEVIAAFEVKSKAIQDLNDTAQVVASNVEDELTAAAINSIYAARRQLAIAFGALTDWWEKSSTHAQSSVRLNALQTTINADDYLKLAYFETLKIACDERE